MKKNIHQERKMNVMTIETAKELSLEEFSALDEEYKGFNGEISKNHQVRDENETFTQFLKKGSEKLKSNPMIKGIFG